MAAKNERIIDEEIAKLLRVLNVGQRPWPLSQQLWALGGKTEGQRAALRQALIETYEPDIAPADWVTNAMWLAASGEKPPR